MLALSIFEILYAEKLALKLEMIIENKNEKIASVSAVRKLGNKNVKLTKFCIAKRNGKTHRNVKKMAKKDALAFSKNCSNATMRKSFFLLAPIERKIANSFFRIPVTSSEITRRREKHKTHIKIERSKIIFSSDKRLFAISLVIVFVLTLIVFFTLLPIRLATESTS